MNAAEAQQLFQQGRLQEAEQLASKILERMPANVEALGVMGLVALRRADTKRAQDWLERAVTANPRDSLTHHYLGRVHDASGNPDAASAAHRKAVQLAPDFFIARIHLAAALERAGAADDALIQYARALQDAQNKGRWLNAETTAPGIQPLVEHAVGFVKQQRAAALAGLLEPLKTAHGPESMRRVEHALRIYFLEDAPVYVDERQKPSFFLLPGLPTSPYLARELFPWMAELEAATQGIRDELNALLPSATGRERVFTSDAIELQNLRGEGTAPSWNGYYFYRHGERREDNCASCPVTAAALDRLPLSHVREHGPEVLFSVFTAGTHLLPHRGVTNTRLVAHLPLIVPSDCALSVGGEIHAWREGRVVVFDDTYEHEAWNRSKEIRVVLIFDIWNPHLTEVEKLAIADLIGTIGDFRKLTESA